MFDFSDKTSSQYKNFEFFVNQETNEPRLLHTLDKSGFPYQFVEKIENPKIFTEDNLLSKDECDYLIWLATESEDWRRPTIPFWNDRNCQLFGMLENRPSAGLVSQKIALDIHDRIKRTISEWFGQEAYVDQIGIVRWPVGSWQMTHIDQVEGTDRVAGSVVFLNDDYTGGKPFYPYYGLQVQPKTGMLYAHDAGHSHLHGVTKIFGTTRYTISSTWTKNPALERYKELMASAREKVASVQFHDMS